MLKFINEEWRGSVINEFGIKAFDFIFHENKCRLKNTVSFLDKWFIRKTIESDLTYLFNNQENGKGKHIETNGNEIILINEKRNIKYHLQNMESQ